MATRQEISWITDEDCKLQDGAALLFGDGSNREVETVGDWSIKWDASNGYLAVTSSAAGGIYLAPASTAAVALKFGSLSSSTAGSGWTLSDSVTRILEVHADDNDTARSTGTQGRAIFGRTMIYANSACEDWGIHGLSKMSAVAKTANVSAGVVGAFESTGTCSTAAGSGNTYCAGVMGRVGTGGSFTIGSGTKVACLLAFGNNANANAFTNAGYVGVCITETDVGTPEDFDVGLDIEASCCVTGIEINTVSGTGIDFPAGETYGKALAYGTFGTPILFGTDEPFEIHGRINSATETKPLMRIRCSSPDGTAMTTGAVTALQVQAYGTSTSNVGYLEGLQCHVGIKANSTIIADTGTMPNFHAGWFKIEDLGNTLTLTGDAAVLCLGWQLTSGATLTGNADWMFLAKEGSDTTPADAFIRVYDGAGGGWATNFLDIPASAPATVSGGTYSTAEGYLTIKVGGSTYRMPFYTGTD